MLKLVGTAVQVDCQNWGASMVDAGADPGYVTRGADGIPERRDTYRSTECRPRGTLDEGLPNAPGITAA